jgi:murein DD-endopeptidase MepM/ murein hydrolase activator NlpD
MRKYNTIIFVPHAKARFRKLTVSTRTLALSAAGAVLLGVCAVGFGWGYLASVGRDREYRQMIAENSRLKSSTAALRQKLEGISRTMGEIESRTRRLAVVAGLSDAGRSGVGGPMVPSSSGAADLARWTGALDSRLSEIEIQLDRRSTITSSTPTVAPVRGILNSGFGSRIDPFTGAGAFHPGLDISTRRHEPVLATAAGVVVRSGWAGDYGKLVEISHGTGYSTLYGHLDSILVRDGQRVQRGERVGLVGSTGRSTGPHLHYEVRRGDRTLNPLEYILDAR